MKTKLISAIAALLFITATTYGQKYTFFGINSALNFDTYQFTDPGNMLQATPLPAVSWGFTVSQEISENLLLETGLIRKIYWEGYQYNVESVNVGTSSDSYATFQFPFRLKTKIGLLKERLTFSPVIGISYAVNTEHGHGLAYGGGILQTENIKISTTYTEDVNLRKSFFLLETGLQLGYRLKEDFLLTLNAGYFNGFDKVSQIDYEYQVNDSRIRRAYAHSNGSYWNFELGIGYRISNFWQNK